MRAAALAGPDEVALAEARIAAANGPLTARAVAAVPPALQKDPGLLFARVQDARRANRAREAAGWLALAPTDAAALIDPDAWWSEQRMVARELLDIGEPRQAFALCAAAAPASVPAKVDAAFHAGWIALRFLGEAEEAAKRFDAANAVAATPLSIARAGYWRGRAAEALGRADEARRFYERAAAFPIAYYGQLAAERLGRSALVLRAPAAVAAPEARDEATRVVAWLYAAGLDDLANALAQAAAASGATKRSSPRSPTRWPRMATPPPTSPSARSSPNAASRSTLPPSRCRACRNSRRSRVRPTCRASTRWRGRRASSRARPPPAWAPRD